MIDPRRLAFDIDGVETVKHFYRINDYGELTNQSSIWYYKNALSSDTVTGSTIAEGYCKPSKRKLKGGWKLYARVRG